MLLVNISVNALDSGASRAKLWSWSHHPQIHVMTGLKTLSIESCVNNEILMQALRGHASNCYSSQNLQGQIWSLERVVQKRG